MIRNPYSAVLAETLVSHEFVLKENEEVLASYRARPSLAREQARQEIANKEGAYGKRQVFELVQNAADAMLGETEGIIHVLLTDEALYCANTGRGLTQSGLRAILQVYLSEKEGEQIGRYGLGFKSVLGVTSRPEIHTKALSLMFDPEWSREQILKASPTATGETPTLRLVRPKDPAECIGENSVLAELLVWAETVVRLPFENEVPEWLSEDLESFPGMFLLFSPHVTRLILENRLEVSLRNISRSGAQPVIVRENDLESEWRLFTSTVNPSEQARKDGGTFAGRDRIEVTWAVPVRGRFIESGFWTFFPMEKEPMSLRGILNAAWKLNDDRQNILEGAFNDELLDFGARMVLEGIPDLYDSNDPGKLLEIYPARYAERSGADLWLTRKFYNQSFSYPTVPDTSGELRACRSLRLPPAKIPDSAVKLWAQCPFLPRNWPHPSCLSTATRNSRLDLLKSVEQSRSSVKSWLEALVDDTDLSSDLPEVEYEELRIERSACAIQVGAVLLQAGNTEMERAVLSSRIVLTAKGDFVEPDNAQVFLPSADLPMETGVHLIHPRISCREDLADVLAVYEFEEVDATSELQALLDGAYLGSFGHDDWDRLWSLVAKIEMDPSTSGRAKTILRQLTSYWLPRDICVKVLSGEFRQLSQALLPGTIVPEDGSRDSAVAIDISYHGSHLDVIKALDAVESPSASGGTSRESWFPTYQSEARDQFFTQRLSSRPQPERLGFVEDRFPGPLETLRLLSDEGRAVLSAHLLVDVEESPSEWTLRHKSRPDAYPTIRFPSPVLWMLKKEGRLHTSKGIVPPSEAVSSEFDRWREFLPVADCGATASDLLGLAREASQLTDRQWANACKQVSRCKDTGEIARFYAFFCRERPAPQLIWAECAGFIESFLPSDVVATHDPQVAEALKPLGKAVLLTDRRDEAVDLCRFWGLQNAGEAVRVQPKFVQNGPEQAIGDMFPGLKWKLDEQNRDLRLVPCESLRKEVRTTAGTQSEDVPVLAQEGRILWRDTLPKEELLDEVLSQLHLELAHEEKATILRHAERESRSQRTTLVRNAHEVPEKLLAAVGVESLRRALSESVLALAERSYGSLTDRLIADLFVAVYGVESLIALKEDLQTNGIDVPTTWAGSHRARQFVKGLGFPNEYAGFPTSERLAALDIEGPPSLPRLHEFQDSIVESIRRLLRSDAKGRIRGLLSLPTGAGKTRVAVQALVGAIREDELEGPILWVAQSDELCEQAVQTWSDVWRALGNGLRLRINRLWASNDADEYAEGPQIVVATVQKLQNVVKDPAYDWLAGCSAMIVDEAHLSVTKSYTHLLDWIDDCDRLKRCPVVGLTATPFRGNEEETKRLVSRYGGVRLDGGTLGEHAYRILQDMGVLAEVDHQALEGIDVHMTPSELSELERMRLIPSSVADKIGASVARNAVLINSIKQLPSDWPVLLFAVSVEHAKTLAALLSTEGISSVAISGETSSGARRHYIRQFRLGKIRVLTNYGVLTTGFDAPAVRAIYVARPTFSPVLYQQMIGRGLRGPLNGGKERCLISNVRDNFVQFGEQLAFTQFEYLWKRPSGADATSR